MQSDEYLAHDALALADLVRRKELAPRELVDAAIARIEEVNPRLNAVVHTMFEQARRDADRGVGTGPFAGVPFLIKDLLTSYEGEPLTSGSDLYKGWNAPRDSELMRRYRAAGVIVLGKTNTPEFGLAPYTEPRSAGIARNPWNLALTTGGSSGGSAAAVASGMVPMAGGGDGGGSLRIPASCCGVFALKPTRGRVPTGPEYGEIWAGAVSEGVISRSVRDSAAMLDAIEGGDVGAPYVIPAPARPYLEEVTAPPGRLRVAFSDAPGLGHEIHPDCRAAVRDAAALLESLGHHVEERSLPIEREPFNAAFLTVICGETAADIDDAAARIGRRPTRADVETATWGLAMLGGSVSAGEYASAVRHLQRAARPIGAFFEEIDIFLTPTLGMPPVPHGALQPRPAELATMRLFGALRAGALMRRLGAITQAAGTIFDFTPYPPIFNITGQPAMSVPLMWNAGGLPIGVHIAAAFGDEATLFRVAGQLEEARGWRAKRPAL